MSLMILIYISSCVEIPNTSLRKLTSDELIQRANDGNWPDIKTVTYMNPNGDTLLIDSIVKMNYNEIAFDDYVDESGKVVVAIVRPSTKEDLEVRQKMKAVNLENNLDGRLSSYPFYSQHLGQERTLTTYIPKSAYPINTYFYLTDGTFVKYLAPKIDSLIQSKLITPIKLIGINCDRTNRQKEYIYKDASAELFKKHLAFFTQEVPDSLENQSYPNKTQRHLFGYSNGADFCKHIGINYPEWAETIIAMSSVAYFPNLTNFERDNVSYPKFYFSSGKFEELANRNLFLKTDLEKLGACVSYEKHPGDHELTIWRDRFVEHLLNNFQYSES